MPADDIQSELSRARDLGIDTCGRIAEFWGFTRTMGRAFGLLYLSREPLPQADLQKRLSISAGSASMTLAALGRWGVVHRVWVRGQRREHYQAETDFWKMIAGVLNERERREIGAAVEVVERAEAGARAAHLAVRGQAATPAGKKLKAEAEFTLERLARLREICGLGETMLDMLLGQLTLDVGKFRHLLRVDQAGAPHPQAGAPHPQAGAPHPQAGAPNPQTGAPHPQTGAPAKPTAAAATARKEAAPAREKRTRR